MTTESISATIRPTVEFLRERFGDREPKVGVILGSGLGRFADTLADPIAIPYGDIPSFPTSSVVGHAGRLVCGRAPGDDSGGWICVMQGRVHYYEGYAMAQVVFPARVLVSLGCRTLLITNAAGGINPDYVAGDLVLLSDHLNYIGANPLHGPNDPELGPRFPDMSAAYHPELRQIARDVAQAQGVDLKEGVYAGLSGPSYETPAEIRALGRLGADLVGMSTVPEVIAANHMGARCVGISCCTNLAAGISPQELSHDEVKETASRVEKTFVTLVGGIVARLAREAA